LYQTFSLDIRSYQGDKFEFDYITTYQGIRFPTKPIIGSTSHHLPFKLNVRYRNKKTSSSREFSRSGIYLIAHYDNIPYLLRRIHSKVITLMKEQ